MVALIRGISSIIADASRQRTNRKIAELNNDIDSLEREIAARSPVRLTTEAVPQRFPNKEAAQAFGERWSRGDATSFTARAVDAKGFDEDSQYFDSSSVSGGILYSAPALFFGMREAYRDDDKWFLEFTRAKKGWLQAYRASLEENHA